MDAPGIQFLGHEIELAAPSAKPVELPQFDARARWKTFVPLIVVFAILNFVPAISRVAGYEPDDNSWKSVPRWQTWLLVSWTIEATLLAIWLALAPVRVSERSALIGLTYLVWHLATVIGVVGVFWMDDVRVELFLPLALLELSYFAGLATALGAFRYFRGWQLTGADWSGPLPPGKYLRFGLLQLLAFMTGLAAYMAVCKISGITALALGAFVCGLAAAPVVVATMWLLLAKVRTRTTMLAAIAVLLVVMAATIEFAGFRIARSGPIVAEAIQGGLFGLAFSLAWFRVGNWQLTHKKSAVARIVGAPEPSCVNSVTS